MLPRGWDRPLYVQPFDHRGSFQSGLFGWKPPLSEAQTNEVAGSKRIIPELEAKDPPPQKHDSSTNTLIERYRAQRAAAS